MLKTNEIFVRDPYVLLYENKYYLYGSRGYETWGHCTGLDVYVSDDLENWSEPITVFTPPADFWSDTHFWAPEVHFYNGKFYMFVSFKSDTRHRGTQILSADSPMGMFHPISKYPVTPSDMECLDGTLYVDENGKPNIIFCNEWTQIGNGTVCTMPLTENLEPGGEVKVLFSAGDCKWVKTLTEGKEDFCTDGPCLYRTKTGRLLIIWSSYSENGYTVAAAYSDDGTLYGNWHHIDKLISNSDGGHGMLFKTKEGELTFVMHSPNIPGSERPLFMKAVDTGDSIELV